MSCRSRRRSLTDRDDVSSDYPTRKSTVPGSLPYGGNNWACRSARPSPPLRLLASSMEREARLRLASSDSDTRACKSSGPPGPSPRRLQLLPRQLAHLEEAGRPKSGGGIGGDYHYQSAPLHNSARASGISTQHPALSQALVLGLRLKA